MSCRNFSDAKNKEFVEKHTTTVSGAMTATTLNTAANKACGANKKKFTLVFCHSDVSTGLENLNLIERLKYTDKDGIQRDLELGTWNGKLVIVTDQMPVSEGYFDADANTDGALKIIASGAPADGEILLSKVTPYFGSKTLAANDYVVAGVQYTTYAMGNGAFSYEDIGVKVPYEMARDPKTNGGEDLLYMRQRKVFAPFGLCPMRRKRRQAPAPRRLNWKTAATGRWFIPVKAPQVSVPTSTTRPFPLPGFFPVAKGGEPRCVIKRLQC